MKPEAPPLRDGRLRAIATLLPLGFVGHAIQLLGEDRPWTNLAEPRYHYTPGWHLALSPWVVVGLAVLLYVCVLGLMVRRNRFWLLATVSAYAAHYLTYPFRIRNHMTMMLASLVVIGGCFLVAGREARAGAKSSRVVERWAVRGVGIVLCITYTFAAVHKSNARFVDLDYPTAALGAVDDFWIYGDLGHAAPAWAKAFAIYGTLVVEYVVPWIALLFRRLTVPMVLVLMAFHFPHIAVMNVADYPMIASCFYPALFGEAHWRRLSLHLRASPWTLGGAALGVAMQVWWMPYVGPLMVFGAAVMAVWGAWTGAMAAMVWTRWR